MSTYPNNARSMSDAEAAAWRAPSSQRPLDYEDRLRQAQNQQQPGNPRWPSYPIEQQPPPSYRPLSEADVQRIAEAVVARLRADTTAA